MEARRLGALFLATLTLGAALVAPVAAQSTPPATSGSGSGSGSLQISTDRSAYPPGGPVLFNLQNHLAWTITLDRLDVYRGATPVARVPLDAATVETAGRFNFTWTGSSINDTYFGILLYSVAQPMPDGSIYTYPQQAYVFNPSGRQGWLIDARIGTAPDARPPPPPPSPGATPPPPGGPPVQGPAEGRLAIVLARANATYRAGETVAFRLQNVGDANLTASTPCDVGFAIIDNMGRLVYDSAGGRNAPCIEVIAVLQPGQSIALAWNQTVDGGAPAPPGPYGLAGRFGAAQARAKIFIEGDGPRPGPVLTLIAPPRPVPPGADVSFGLAHHGTATLEGNATLEIRDGSGAVVSTRSLGFLRLEPDQPLRVNWTPQTRAGARAEPGTYGAVVLLGDARAQARFELLSSAPPPPPPQEAPPGQPRSPPPGPGAPPPGPPPFVGRIAIQPGATIGLSASGVYQGDWISFRLDAEHRKILDFRVRGTLVLPELPLPGSGPLRTAAVPGALVVSSGDVRVFLYDTPAGALRMEVPGAATVAMDLPALGDVTANGTDAGSLEVPGLGAIVRVQGQGRVTRDAGQLRVAVDAAPGGQASGFTIRSFPAASAATEGGERAALQAALPRAIALDRVAAEAYLSVDNATTRVSVVPYVAGDVNITVLHRAARALELSVNVSEHRGRTLAFHLGEGVFHLDDGRVEVLLDGLPMTLASSLEDVLDPDDDGLQAEYVIVQAAAGTELLVSVPHFSEHTISVQGFSETAVSLAPYGAALGFVAIVGAAVYMMRRGRRGEP